MNNSSEVLIHLLTGSPSLVLGVAANTTINSVIRRYRRRGSHIPRGLFHLITSNGSDDGILLPLNTVDSALGISTCLCGLGLGFSGRVLLLTALLPGSRTSQVSDGFDDGALHGVILPSGLRWDIFWRESTSEKYKLGK